MIKHNERMLYRIICNRQVIKSRRTIDSWLTCVINTAYGHWQILQGINRRSHDFVMYTWRMAEWTVATNALALSLHKIISGALPTSTEMFVYSLWMVIATTFVSKNFMLFKPSSFQRFSLRRILNLTKKPKTQNKCGSYFCQNENNS